MHERDLGSGPRFGADVYELHEAGQVAFPDLAAVYSRAAAELHDVTHLLNGIAARLDHVGVWGVSAQAEVLYETAAATSRRLHLTGEALVSMAAEFRVSDEAAATTFRQLTGEHRDVLLAGPTWSPPPRPDDLPDWGPRDLLGDDGLDEALAEAGIPPSIPEPPPSPENALGPR